MRPLLRIFALIWRAERWSLLRGIALSIVVLLMGVALLGLSGWFIIAAGAAGIAGTGALFDVFRPSAGVRFLALGRTAARYGERLLTHDATLKALSALRVRLLAGLSAAPFPVMQRFRGAQVLNRLTCDIDALDGVALRLVIPLLAGGATLVLAWVALALLVDPRVAAWSVLSLVTGGALALVWSARRSARPSRRAEAAAQAFRTRTIDHLRGRAMLAFAGQLETSSAHVRAADIRARTDRLALARIERRSGAALSFTATLAAAGALFLGAELARAGTISPALAALGFFATLALAEVIGPLRRAMSELGGMRDAARRVTHWLPEEAPIRSVNAAPLTGDALSLSDVSIANGPDGPPLIEGVSLALAPGEILALTGASGSGKTTLLNSIAGLLPSRAGEIRIAGRSLPDWTEPDLRAHLGYLPQRATLIGGTIAENLRLGAPMATEDAMETVLDAVALRPVIATLGGLEARLGEGGRGLSGGETRRLVLARTLLRRPALLLLDEPTEGLDRDTARAVLAGLRAHCPGAAILLAAHRGVERDWAGKALSLDREVRKEIDIF
ncbi:ATP-binding cassette domain-containing protein [Tropicimonas sp. TH_r6]|uniref:amino acid ABC transporter ATP-binding/permease protein n=1 Tax=Tropicimonas sp. TH_r6 TaxID=3082085 RepID=UPI0029551E69|nr:ATP-binding cassette domain-containing protein [Tropicimonas sp. TH_r6]MDV7142809.1 ATP-binding cassette domain-containing protein [Tropicimonas sp. TH_r6]